MKINIKLMRKKLKRKMIIKIMIQGKIFQIIKIK